MADARTRAERVADTRALLARPELDAWVASWSADGGGHLVPLSAARDGTHVILATEPAALTTRNLEQVLAERLALIRGDRAPDEADPKEARARQRKSA